MYQSDASIASRQDKITTFGSAVSTFLTAAHDPTFDVDRYDIVYFKRAFMHRSCRHR